MGTLGADKAAQPDFNRHGVGLALFGIGQFPARIGVEGVHKQVPLSTYVLRFPPLRSNEARPFIQKKYESDCAILRRVK